MQTVRVLLVLATAASIVPLGLPSSTLETGLDGASKAPPSPLPPHSRPEGNVGGPHPLPDRSRRRFGNDDAEGWKEGWEDGAQRVVNLRLGGGGGGVELEGALAHVIAQRPPRTIACLHPDAPCLSEALSRVGGSLVLSRGQLEAVVSWSRIAAPSLTWEAGPPLAAPRTARPKAEHTLEASRAAPGNSTGGRARRALGVWDTSFFSGFHPLGAVEEKIQRLVEEFPMLVSVSDLAYRTSEGRAIKALRIASHRFRSLPSWQRPSTIFLIGGFHAREHLSISVALYLAEALAIGQTHDPDVRALLERVQVFVVPVINPDGYAFTFTPEGQECVLGGDDERAGRCNRLWRKNRRPPPTMEEGAPGAGCYGVDLNRNFPIEWSKSDPCADVYGGPRMQSEAESLAYRSLVNRHLPIGVLEYHTFGQKISYSWQFTNQNHEENAEREEIARRMSAAMGGDYLYGNGDMRGELYLIKGGSVDWGAREFPSMHHMLIELPPKHWKTAPFLGANEGAAFFADPWDIIPTGQQQMAALKVFIQESLGEHVVASLPAPLVRATPPPAHTCCSCREGRNATVIDFAIKPNYYPSDNRWRIWGPRNGLLWDVLAEGNTVTTPRATMSVCEEGTYKLEVWDRDGDGMCCDKGVGSYHLTVDGVELRFVLRDPTDTYDTLYTPPLRIPPTRDDDL